MEIPIFNGLIAATFTPMHSDGEINYSVIKDYVDILVEQNVCGVYVNGANGEGTSLTIDERKKVAEMWIKLGKGKLEYVIIHVGSTCLKDSQEMAGHAEEAGAEAIACVPPFFYRPPTISTLVEYLAEVAKAAPNLPILYYHIPSMTGVDFSMYHLFEEAEKRIPNFGGMKYTSYDLFDFGRCVAKYSERFNLCYSQDEQFSMAVLLGAKSGVGGTYNYGGRIYKRIHKAAQKGDGKTIAKLQLLLHQTIGVCFDSGFTVSVNKAIMEAITGLKVGPARLPLEKVPKEKISTIIEGLNKIGFLEERKN